MDVLLAWAQLSDPDCIRQMLRARTLVTHAPVTIEATPLGRRHASGSVLFGPGWAVTNARPGPDAAQLGQALRWGFVTLAGFLVGPRVQADSTGRATRYEPAAS